MEPVGSAYRTQLGPPRIDALAAVQFGVVTRRQLLDAGLQRGAITRRIAGGQLHPIYRGVYAVGHPVLTPNGRRLAAVLACGDGAALSHGSAGVVHELRRSSARMHVTVPRGSHSREGITVHRVRRLAPEDVTVVDGIPVTTVARTILDLAEQSTPRSLANVLERAERLQVFDLNALRATIARNPGRHGAKALAEALDIEAPSKEALQREFLAVVRAAGLPEPQREAQVGAYHVDFLWPQARLAVETDGRAWHDTRAAFERDRQRDLDLAARGIQTLRITWRMVTREAPALAATIGDLVTFGRI